MAEKKLLDQVRDYLRIKHYSYKTEKSYVAWIKRFILFHHKRHPRKMGEKEINEYLSQNWNRAQAPSRRIRPAKGC